MKIPKKVDKLTVVQYGRFIECERSNMDEIDKANKLLSIVTGKTLDEIESLDLSTLDFHYRKLSVLRASTPSGKINKVLWIKGKRFRLVKSERHLNTNQFTMWETHANNPIRNYNKLAACIYLRHKPFTKPTFHKDDFAEVAELFSTCTVGQLFGALFFCKVRLEKLKQTSQAYLSQAEIEIQNHTTAILNLLKDSGVSTDGIMSLTAQQMEALFWKMN